MGSVDFSLAVLHTVAVHHRNLGLAVALLGNMSCCYKALEIIQHVFALRFQRHLSWRVTWCRILQTDVRELFLVSGFRV